MFHKMARAMLVTAQSAFTAGEPSIDRSPMVAVSRRQTAAAP